MQKCSILTTSLKKRKKTTLNRIYYYCIYSNRDSRVRRNRNMKGKEEGLKKLSGRAGGRLKEG